MKCVKCGRNAGNDGFCTCCGFDNKHIAKAQNTANYYYNLGLEKANMHDLSGAASQLEKALTYNKCHKDARNLLGLVYYEMGEAGKAYIEWKKSAALVTVEENIANLYIRQMEEHPAIFEEINETAKKFNQALSYAKQGSDDLALIQIKKVLSITPNFVRGHLLFAVIHMREGNNEAAKQDLYNALAIDNLNTTALRYLDSMGEKSQNAPIVVKEKPSKPDNDNLRNVRPVDHYEDPNKETWKQFVYMLVGLVIGVIAMFVLVIPSVKAGVSVDYNNLKKEYKQTVEEKDSEITRLQDDKASLESNNQKLERRLKVYEGSKNEDSMYDSLLKASQAYSKGDYIECAKYLENVSEEDLPSKTSKKLYNSMADTAYSNAATQLYNSGKALVSRYKYADALKDLKSAYKYRKNDYNILYELAFCYKQTGKTEKATEYFYEIINKSGDSDLIRRASNYGLGVTVKTGKEMAEAAAKGNKNEGATTEASTEEATTEAEE